MEPENTATNGKKRIFLAIAIVALVVVAVIVVYLFIQKDNLLQLQKSPTSAIIENSDIPYILSDEERALIEMRMNASRTIPISKKEKTAIAQKAQSAESFSALTEVEKTALETRIIIQ